MHRSSSFLLTALAAVAVLSLSDTASAQPQLVVTPASATNQSTPLIFNNVPSGGVSPSQNITVTTSNSTMATVTLQVNAASPWLVVTPGASVNVPATLNVQCNTSTLMAGSYSGSFTMSVSGAPVVGGVPVGQVTVYVSLTVSGTSQLSANPPSLTFTALAGATVGSPASTQVQISSSGVPLNYTLQAQTNDGHNWLLLNATQGSTGGTPFSVSVNPSVLSATAYPAIFNGLITASSTTTLDAVQISVQLTLNTTASLSVTPTSPPPFLYQVGSVFDPPAQQLAIASSNGSTTFTIQESPSVSWLSLSAVSGSAGSNPTMITMNVTPHEQALTPNTYTTNLIITPAGQSPLPAVPVTLVVSAHALLQLSTNSLSFTAPFGGAVPPTQSLTITGSGSSAIGFTVSSNASWLTATTSASTTPATIVVQANPASLAVNNYSGTLTITPTNGDTYTEVINVSFAISAAAQLLAAPANLLFSYEIGQATPAAQIIDIGSSGQSLNFSVNLNTTSCGSNWLQAQPNSVFTNATLTVSVITTGMTAGTCSGTISLAYTTALGPANLPIQVTVAVSNAAELGIQTLPGFGIVTGALNSAPIQQQISLTSTDPANQVPFSAAVINASGGSWLGILGATSGTTPQVVTVDIVPNAVATAGVYTGSVVISSPTLAFTQFSLPVTLTATSTTTVAVAPPSLTFTEAQGGTVPAGQTLTITSSPGNASKTPVIASITGGNWLQISPGSGSTNSSMQVSILPNTLIAGNYQAQISFTYQGSATISATVNVTLTVTAAQTVTAAPTSLGFSYQIGGAAPASQALSITSTGGPVTVAVSTSSGSGWLSIDNKGGATPQTVNVSVNPAGLSVQTYSGTISISAPGVLATALSIPVTFTVSAPPAPQPVTIGNNATGGFGPVAPGEELAIKGNLLGPSTPAAGVLFQVNSSGGINSTLAGVQVMFDNNAGTPVYVSANQINVIVPYEINGRLSTTMTVIYNGVSSQPFQLSVAAASPGLFTNNFTGSGQVAALNQDTSVNGSGAGFAAVPRGQVIVLYGTGGGQTNPVSFTGTVTPIPTSASQLLNIPNVTATVGGLPATVEFAGAAPGLISGVMQVNVLVPPGVTPGSAVPVTIAVGGIPSPGGTTIAVQ